MTRSGWTGRRRRCWRSWRGGWAPNRWAWCSATRVPGGDLAGLPELVVGGLPERGGAGAAGLGAGRAVGCAGPGADRGRDGRQSAGAAGAAARVDGGGAGGRVRAARRGAAGGQHRGQLPAGGWRLCRLQTRRLLLVAAADPTGDPVLVWRAAGQLAIGAAAARPAVEAGLVEFGARVRFRHPLVRSAAYRSASVPDRQEAHRGAGRGHRPGRLIRTGGPGTGPRPRPGRMRTWPPSWNGRRGGRRPAAGWPPPRRSVSGRRR